jgi:hypothetical protein
VDQVPRFQVILQAAPPSVRAEGVAMALPEGSA